MNYPKLRLFCSSRFVCEFQWGEVECRGLPLHGQCLENGWLKGWVQRYTWLSGTTNASSHLWGPHIRIRSTSMAGGFPSNSPSVPSSPYRPLTQASYLQVSTQRLMFKKSECYTTSMTEMLATSLQLLPHPSFSVLTIELQA